MLEKEKEAINQILLSTNVWNSVHDLFVVWINIFFVDFDHIMFSNIGTN